MKFYIRRVSQWHNPDIPPCEDAFLGKDGKWIVDIRNLKSLLNLIGKEGELIIDKGAIIIYDDYLE